MRFNEDQFNILASKAKKFAIKRGYLYKKSGKKQSSDGQTVRLQKRWYALHYNLLFYYETESSPKAQGVILVERSICRRYPNPNVCGFVIGSENDDHRQFMFVANTEDECNDWIEAINESSGEGLRAKNDEYRDRIRQLESQILREKEAKERLQRECADQWSQVARLKNEVSSLRDKTLVYRKNSGRHSDSSRDSTNSNVVGSNVSGTFSDDDTFGNYTEKEREKIAKLQCCIRGWLVRRRFLRLVTIFIYSPEAELLMKRNRILWQFIVSEGDYVQQLTTLVDVFHKPLSMAAESRCPACSKQEVKSIFANCDIILILHKMFLEGINQRLKYWPDMHFDDYLSAMVSMLPVYHEYLRNHTYALHTLSHCKRRPQFMKLLNWHESKPECNGQTLEQFLHYPVALLPTYARVLRELLEVTPENNPEKNKLQEILEKLESLHNSLNDQLSECESIKQTLEIERMIDGGCDVLLDPNQKCIRTGLLRHYVASRIGLGIVREKVRHCFLFSRHLIITSRSGDGCLRLAKVCGKIPLKYTTLVEDVDDPNVPQNTRHLAFTLQIHSKIVCFDVTLMATRPTDKAIWTSDISQCIYNLSLEDPDDEDDGEYDSEDQKSKDVDAPNNNETTTNLSSKTLPFRTTSIKDDERLTTDSDDIKYAEPAGPNNLPQILYGSIDRLIERLVDPRLPGTDFMDTFLVTYRYFTTAKFVLQSLIDFYRHLEEERTGKKCRKESSVQGEIEKDSRRKTSNVTSFAALSRSLSTPESRERSSSIMSTSSSMSSFDDYDSLSPLSPNDVVNFVTLNRRQSKTQWYENPLVGPGNDSRKPRSMSQESGSLSDKSESSAQSRRKTTPASFMNSSYQGNTLRRSSMQVSERPRNTDTLISQNAKTDLMRTGSEQSVSSLCSDEMYDQQLETLMESSKENGLTERDEHFIEYNIEADTEDVETHLENGDAVQHERGIDVEEVDDGDSIGELHLDLKQRMLVRQHMNDHRPSLPAILPSRSQGKDLAKWLGLTDGPNSTMHANKKKNRKDKSKEKEKELKMSRSPSTSSSNSSQSGDRRSTILEEFEKIEKPPTPTSMRRTLAAAISSPFPRPKPKLGKDPESPKKKIFNFNRNLKSPKSTGMKRSKSDMIHPGFVADDEQDGSPKARSLGSRMSAGDEETRSLCSVTLPDEISLKESLSEGNIKEKASPKTKKGKHVTLKLDKVPDVKPRADSHDFSRDSSRVSMRAILPNRAPLKILNIMKHWVSKHYQDFERDTELAQKLRDFFRDVKSNPDSLPVVKEIIKSMERLMETNRQSISNFIEDVFMREASNQVVLPDEFPTTWTPIKIADELTLLEHYLYGKISTQEFMKCAWTKKDKEIQSPYITKISRRFNQVSGMVAVEVIRGATQEERASRIGFWIAVAARCRDLNNFNSVLQITSGLMKSSVYRLKKSWEFVNKQLREILNDLQTLVSADNCFGKLREAIHNCNPPCVPFIGFYLTDLLFMDERSPNKNDNGLINFGKMTKISRAIREIRQYQQLRYTMEFDVDMAQYLLASHIDCDAQDFEDQLYEQSLQAEPRG